MDRKPQIIMPSNIEGHHNTGIQQSMERLEAGQTARDLSTVIVVPTRGGTSLSPRWVNSLMNLMRPMNQQVVGPIFMSGMEVGVAYNQAIEWIQNNLPKFKYMLTWEDDVLPPPDGLLKLYEGMKKFDVVGGLYWTKGELGQPMIYGDVTDPQLNFRPQKPAVETLHEAYGLGMGFNLFKMSMFKKVQKPWFVTEQRWDPGSGSRVYTQDLYFYERARKEGFKFACDTRIKAGHFDAENDYVW
jgi:hypothetical protein